MTDDRGLVEIRRLAEAEFSTWVRTSMRAFGAHPASTSEPFFRQIIEVDRAIGAYVDGNVIGTATVGSFTLTLPGGELSVADLAAVYLGGAKLATLHRAGRVEEHRAGAVDKLDRAMATERDPWTIDL